MRVRIDDLIKTDASGKPNNMTPFICKVGAAPARCSSRCILKRAVAAS